MHTRRGPYALLIVLFLFAAPAAAQQWTFSFKTVDNEEWRPDHHYLFTESDIRSFARTKCNRNRDIRSVKIIGPGKEAVTSCEALTAPSSHSTVDVHEPDSSNYSDNMANALSAVAKVYNSPSGDQPVTANDRRALKNCELDKQLSMYSDCECARNALAPVPPGAAYGDSPFRRALEACPAEKAHIEREFYASCMKTYDHGAETDFVCRCMATDVASKFVVNPDYGHLEQLKLDAWHSCLAQR